MDCRLKTDLEAGMKPKLAYEKAKKRERSALNRKQGIVERAADRINKDNKWYEKLDKQIRDERRSR